MILIDLELTCQANSSISWYVPTALVLSQQHVLFVIFINNVCYCKVKINCERFPEWIGEIKVRFWVTIFNCHELTVLDLTVLNHQGNFVVFLPPAFDFGSQLHFVRIDDGNYPGNEENKKKLQEICKANCKKI